MSCSTILGSAILPSKSPLFLSFQRFHALSSPQLWLLGYSFTPPFLVSSIGSAETDTTPPNQLLTSPQTSTGNGQRFSVVSPQPPPSPIPLNPLFLGGCCHFSLGWLPLDIISPKRLRLHALVYETSWVMTLGCSTWCKITSTWSLGSLI